MLILCSFTLLSRTLALAVTTYSSLVRRELRIARHVAANLRAFRVENQKPCAGRAGAMRRAERGARKRPARANANLLRGIFRNNLIIACVSVTIGFCLLPPALPPSTPASTPFFICYGYANGGNASLAIQQHNNKQTNAISNAGARAGDE